MPQNKQQAPAKLQRRYGKLAIRAVEAQKDKQGKVVFQPIREYALGDKGFHAYKMEAEKLQKEFDADSDPVRVYVTENVSCSGRTASLPGSGGGTLRVT